VNGTVVFDQTLAVTGVPTFTAQIKAMAGIDNNAMKIWNMADPVFDQDAATKKYVDAAGILSTWTQPTAGANGSTLGLRYRKVAGSTMVFYGKLGNTAPLETLFTIPLLPPYESFTYVGSGLNGALSFMDYMHVTIQGGGMAFSCERGLTAGDTIYIDAFTFQTSG
jgi:hypothetical protein